LVSLFDADTGLSFVGDPKDAPWEQLRGQDICCHNYSFDSAVLRELERRKIIPFPLEEKGFCTANLVAYLQAPRSLLGSSAELLGIGLDKTNRDKFKGKDYRTLPQTVKWEIAEYALKDAKACWLLWKKFGHLMPDVERRLSAHTTLMGDRGIALDIDGVEAGIRHYKEILWGLEKLIPWAKTAPIMSLPQMHAACVKVGIPAPESTAKNDESFQIWADQYAARVPFVAALSKYRSVNRALSVLEAMRIRHVDDRLRYGLKYYGAVPTGRWAGDSGLNMQNFTRDAIEGVDIRQMLVAAPGKKFISADLSQIEPRVSLMVTGDSTQLDLIRNGMCIYEAHSRQTLGYNQSISMKEAAKKDEAIAKMRQFAKARVLGLTYGQWGKGFQAYAKTFGIELTLEQAQEQVAQFRRANPKLVKFWDSLEQGIRVSRGQTFELELPSGRFMRYFDVAVSRNAKGFMDYRARPVRGESATYYSQGKLHNNCLAGGTEILTQGRGWVRLDSLCEGDYVWDGFEFVQHAGLLMRGEQVVLGVAGVLATPDHKFLTCRGWLAAEKACTKSIMDLSPPNVRLTLPRKSRWLSNFGWPRRKALESSVPVRPNALDRSQGATADQEDSTWLLARMPYKPGCGGEQEHEARDVWAPALHRVAQYARPLLQSLASSLPQLRRSWNRGLCVVGQQLRCVFGRYAAVVEAGAGPRPTRQQCWIFPGELPLGDSKGELSKPAQQHPAVGISGGLARAGQVCGNQVDDSALPDTARLELGENPPHARCEVFDILNCGPRHQFVVRASASSPILIASNCCQGTARDVLGEAVLAIEYELGLPVVLTVHDEVLVEVDAADAEDARVEVSRIMARPPEWMPDLPLASDCFVSDRYEK
jgi:DNA polymerase I-like protein with 3'-5' exonuclease and polymerase domains